MLKDRQKLDAPPHRSSSSTPPAYAAWFVTALALIYAFLAGFHTLQDFDLGWQLASGRWIVQHHRFFFTDVFSYTAAGQSWTYPVLSEIIFYGSYVLGGYALLSWLGALACAGTVALLLRQQNLAVSVLALIAVPLIANRTQTRAEMFTPVLFAAFLGLLWEHFEGRGSRLWRLPLLMVLWVNLHLGFVAGFALCFAYALFESVTLVFPARRQSASARLRRSWIWLVLTVAATLINPWGPFIYSALIRQERAQAFHNLWIVEWEGIHPSWASLYQALDLRDPQSSFWWLVLAGGIAIGAALWQRHWAGAAMLAGSLYLAFQHVRLQALFACVIVIVGGAIIGTSETAASGGPTRRNLPVKLKSVSVALLLVLCTALTAFRSWELASNRYYLRSNQLALFGTGLSWWFPEKAFDFLQREKLPANIFNDYALGGYFTWRLFPAYQDYIDSRAVPFGRELFLKAYELSSEGPDSSDWQQEADSRGINTILVPLARYQGMSLFPQLHVFCRSRSWSPVYLDEVSAIFVRHTRDTEPLIQRLQVDCDRIAFDLKDASGVRFMRSRAESFNAWANAGGILYSLERYPEALEYLDHAESIYPSNANVHLLRALVLQQLGPASDAEQEFRTSLSLESNDQAWFDFGLFYMSEKRYADAAEIFRRSAESSSRPHEMWMALGQAELQLNEAVNALTAFDKAERSSPFEDRSGPLARGFYSLIATGRAKAAYQVGDLAQAVQYQEQAVKLAPSNGRLWMGLADLYDAEGRTTAAAQARAHATNP